MFLLERLHLAGMFDLSANPEVIRKEIVSCLHMVKDGIHAVLVIFSICSRFSEDDQDVICSLVTLFGRKIYNYIVIVFTGGDELEEEEKSLDDFLCNCPESLKKILDLCGNRCVLFDNRTKNKVKITSQFQKLLSSYVNMLLEANDRKPYTSEIFVERKVKLITVCYHIMLTFLYFNNDEKMF
ncbi:putative AIG1-type guanine nucleotide-binding (G) domain-containing protein [Helianthus annuus]|uniref:AIG1-type guanine nucleotide-binding (G) domain-containing protein n=1 Tax=Helianthus annuus TaxID=4232 RepID=A0A9K3JLP4_HELAN|nr:putative AIG1-type guanine nucleotide-binding (G) domain-containing protein [Helianthus annuus]KAJ0603836.1 putative AIG1-type guanine nucleotide-binding (G) domain-containing protein [Helianthus annuus]KAJ0614040.1 putative AIG1-type guanine nucleotide-binding (G) domain-containing protein [Helianthus annuus]KAJ0776377.1 putative AIG1-type guanine nucleotide-binding (G) domain-containing protein [Helianthus annuus]KAJ0938823.1 putative AIG1-type guanine nucleotide-binding (G) domain-contain